MNGNLAQKRMSEFVWYHIHGDGDCNGQTLRAYAQEKRLSRQDCFDLAYFYATTYCCVSAIYLMQHREEINQGSPTSFAETHKGKLIFQSDRKYVRKRDTFEKMLEDWRRRLQREQPAFDGYTGADSGTINTEKALKYVMRRYFFGRFSAYLFVETYCDILNLNATRADGLEYEGDSMTFAAGVCYVYGRDIEAQYIQKNHKLPFSTELFESLIHGIQQYVKQAGGDDSLVKLETSPCAYEKFFKGTRYNGFYADRMLAEIEAMKVASEFEEARRAVLSARSQAINDRYLGERHGWHGIRKELKKSYQQTGHITDYRG